DLANGYNDGYAVTGSSQFLLDEVNYLTDVGAYTLSPSFYGTYDQTGNVWEWNENVNTHNGTTWREYRGGSYFTAQAPASVAGGRPPTGVNEQFGFRVATVFVPEPASAVLLLAGLMLAFFSARR